MTISIDYANTCILEFQKNIILNPSKITLPITNLVAFPSDGSTCIGSGTPLKDWINQLPEDSYTDITVQFGIYTDASNYSEGIKENNAELIKYLNSVVGRLTVFIIPCNKIENEGVITYEPTSSAFNIGDLNP